MFTTCREFCGKPYTYDLQILNILYNKGDTNHDMNKCILCLFFMPVLLLMHPHQGLFTQKGDCVFCISCIDGKSGLSDIMIINKYNPLSKVRIHEYYQWLMFNVQMLHLGFVSQLASLCERDLYIYDKVLESGSSKTS